MLRHCPKNISRIEEYTSSECPFLTRFDDRRAKSVTIAGCMVFVTLQYALELFGIDVDDEHPRLKVFYDAFESRHSDVISQGIGQPRLTMTAKRFVTTTSQWRIQYTVACGGTALFCVPLARHDTHASLNAVPMNSAHRNAANATLACIAAQNLVHVDGPPMSFASAI